MTLVTENELAQARNDPAFRQQFLVRNLGRLLEALKMHAPLRTIKTPKRHVRSKKARILP